MKKANFILIPILTVVIIIIYLFAMPYNIKESTENIEIDNNTISLKSLSTKQKLAQMIMVRGDSEDYDFAKLNIGGIFLDRQKTEADYSKLISVYQKDSKIKLFVATDMEGAWTPFPNPRPHQDFPFFSEINTPEEAFEIGRAHGELLEKIGFNLNFAPVSEFSDEAYGGRVFLGSEESVRNKISSYIEGLQQSIMGTCKHYPGNSLIANLHKTSDYQSISEKDLELFELCEDKKVSAIMVSHQIVSGALDSNQKPSSVSEEVISSLNDYDGLIIADEINMEGLSGFYKDKIGMYVDLINSGEELILDFELSSKDLDKLLDNLEEKILNGEISLEKIDKAVTKILQKKGYNIIT